MKKLRLLVLPLLATSLISCSKAFYSELPYQDSLKLLSYTKDRTKHLKNLEYDDLSYEEKTTKYITNILEYEYNETFKFNKKSKTMYFMFKGKNKEIDNPERNRDFKEELYFKISKDNSKLEISRNIYDQQFHYYELDMSETCKIYIKRIYNSFSSISGTTSYCTDRLIRDTDNLSSTTDSQFYVKVDPQDRVNNFEVLEKSTCSEYEEIGEFPTYQYANYEDGLITHYICKNFISENHYEETEINVSTSRQRIKFPTIDEKYIHKEYVQNKEEIL